eukprot:GHUV01017197.1.p1 GENE.GHUV01017197.1~~GHUV01017197.1.p1  ORF type:complete len:132 (-),score=16.82 GHUV01017197.1:216-611(-)
MQGGKQHIQTVPLATKYSVYIPQCNAGRAAPCCRTEQHQTPFAACFAVWEFVTGEVPFAGMHHGVIIHRVVTEDLRPGPWPETLRQAPLPANYIPLAEACWSRQASQRPQMSQVLQELLMMLSEVEGEEGV